MHAQPKRFANAWEEQAAATGLRVFPVAIAYDRQAKKWVKHPLVRDWPNAGFHAQTGYDWSRANGFGVLMGHGYYGFDLDSYKPGCEAEAWFESRRLPPTRTHRTVSGGEHRIFMTVNAQRHLPTRQNIVPGLDGRGALGFLAFGRGYEVLDATAPVILHPTVGEEIAAHAGGAAGPVEGEREFLAAFRLDQVEAADHAIERALVTTRALRRRWKGDTSGLRDTSHSSLDHSVARLLGLCGLDEAQIAWALLCRFEHGAARWKPNPAVAARAAARSALKSIQEAKEDHRMGAGYVSPPPPSAEELEVVRAAMRQPMPEVDDAELRRRVGLSSTTLPSSPPRA